MAFQDIIGQEGAIARLKEDLRNHRLAGGYLFIGPEGVGKSLVAKTFAQALNCLEVEGDACGSCLSCLKIQKEAHPDVHIIDYAAAEEIKIEEIRQIEEKIILRPYEARCKVFIINHAHNLNPVSANAFLKTLEEPPAKSLIILISDKPGRLIKTIISRCRIVKFSALKRNALQQILKQKYRFDDDMLHYLAYFSEGRIGSALRLKDRDIIREKNRIIDTFTDSASAGWEEHLARDRQEMRQDLEILAAWFRDLYLLKIGLPEDQLINFDRRQALFKLAHQYSVTQLDEIMHCICDCLLYLDQNINLKLLLNHLGATIRNSN